MLIWTKEYETGFPELDAQHRKLFEIIGQMTNVIDAPVIDITAAQKLVTHLEDYARVHFECEERCMAATHCSSRGINKEAHQLFLEGLQRFKRDFAGSGNKHELLTILQTSLQAWLRNHILKIDTKLRGLS
ncbi:MAG: hemerythrin family protein [Verrucomicrobia bacterium]|nr:hemerythrin family protein [Verrucomicrobiota bacterium]